ncbi:MAG: N-6 DNA methylase [Nanoarchaeota archaeon]|nr:N-6 DNA methylase [Nanoarchaeota archaeon]
MNENQIKKDIQELVNDFKSRYSYYKSLSEPDIETKLIYELFVNILGWDKNDFRQQEKVRRGEKRGRADYGFYIGDRLVFFLEVKKVGIPLDKEADKQVISYALSKRVPFAISTNFEQMKIFCVEEADEGKKIFRVFDKPEDYIEKLQDLLLLSKESFEENKLLKEAIKEERLKKRITIDKPLLNDLMSIRRLIANDIEKNYPEKYEANEKDEIVQRIIDRLIFMRRCEDVGINPENCVLKELRFTSGSQAYKELKRMFEKYNEVYNSGLFAVGIDNDCDNIKVDGNIIRNLVNYLYNSKDGQYIYNFDWIDADVLGQIYEQYLGIILEQTKSGKSKLKEGQAHKKEQGIYYTPTFVVDFIVKNTLLEDIKKKKVKNIKILDTACGSGSFLIKAFDYLYKELSNGKEAGQTKFDNQGIYSIKTEILKNNLFGVDLDKKAVEITKLNLLLKASEKNRKLPEEVDLHIRHGNSLVDNEQIYPNDYFKWERDFQEGSFDVIIGNPPYDVIYSNYKPQEFNYFKQRYSSAEYNPNLFALFLDKSLDLLKEDGYLGFIIPDTLLTNKYFGNVRRKILENCDIIKIIDMSSGIFSNAIVDTIILILRKKKRKGHKIEVGYNISSSEDFIDGKYKTKKVLQENFEKSNNNEFNIYFNKDLSAIKEKMLKNSVLLGAITNIKRGMVTKDNKKFIFNDNSVDKCRDTTKLKKLLIGKDATRYYLNYSGNYIFYDNSAKGGGCWDKNIYEADEKILIALITGGMKYRINATYDNQQFYILQNYNNLLVTDKKFKIKYILALLNSRLINDYYVILFNDKNIKRVQLQQLPIKNISPEEQDKFVEKVDKILDLNKRLIELKDKTTSEKKELLERLEVLDKEIDDLVYEVYNIAEEDKEIIRENIK